VGTEARGPLVHAMRAIVERHGGVVEKYIGDAIMGVGLPPAHEDDALGAVRAVPRNTEAIEELNCVLCARRVASGDVRVTEGCRRNGAHRELNPPPPGPDRFHPLTNDRLSASLTNVVTRRS
jgi:class 3 adenylate cyclase